MGWFKDRYRAEPGGNYPIANKVDYKPDPQPLTGGDAFVENKVLQQMPYEMGEKNIDSNYDATETETKEIDDRFSPNLFGKWKDVYQSWIGMWTFEKAPDSIKRQQLKILHSIFMNNSVGIKKKDSTYFVGSISVTKTDYYGRVLEGTFIPTNVLTGKPDEEKSEQINAGNKDNYLNFDYGVFKIPLFVAIGYYVNQRSFLWEFKETNLRISIVQKIVGVTKNGASILRKALDKIFNLKRSGVLKSIQVIDADKSDDGKRLDTVLKFDNVISTDTPYKGLELMQDIQGITTEIFRVAGLRTDIAKKTGQYNERDTESQAKESSNYFDRCENFQMMSWFNFCYDFKERFGEEICIKVFEKEIKEDNGKEKDKEKEKGKNENI